jgi:hypothetical protein
MGTGIFSVGECGKTGTGTFSRIAGAGTKVKARGLRRLFGQPLKADSPLHANVHPVIKLLLLRHLHTTSSGRVAGFVLQGNGLIALEHLLGCRRLDRLASPDQTPRKRGRQGKGDRHLFS